MNFDSGEALVDLFGAAAVVNARRRLSPFQLTTEELLQQEEQQSETSNQQPETLALTTIVPTIVALSPDMS